MLVKLKTIEQLLAENIIELSEKHYNGYFDKQAGLSIVWKMLPYFGKFIETDGEEDGHLTFEGFMYSVDWLESNEALKVLYGKPNAK